MLFAAMIATAFILANPLANVQPKPCEAGAPERARCYTLIVPEDRERRGGRTIGLNVLVLPARSSPARLPPLFDIDGGPGLPATRNAGAYDSKRLAQHRDIVMVDQRGAGKSNPLHCPAVNAVPIFRPMLPAAEVIRCRQTLQRHADLRLYGTRDAVADLESVRGLLGYGRIDLFGLSYGTTVALRYMHRYPRNVRAALLVGTAPPAARAPRSHAVAAQRGFDLLLADCAHDAACKRHYPDLGRDLQRARILCRAVAAQ